MAGVSRLYLGIDCATRYLALALWSEDRGVLASFAEDVGRDHAARIVTELDALFTRARVPRGAVAAIGVGIGPGSYTGVRVGVATARGLGRAWGVPVAGTSTLAAMAAAALPPGGTGVATLDARRGNVYAGLYRRPRDPADLRMETVAAATRLPREDLVRRFGDAPVVEDAAPLAAAAAAAARDGAPPEPVYL